MESNVFTITLSSRIIAIGVGFEMYNGVLNLSIIVPFLCLDIYFKKSSKNYWFGINYI